MKKTYEEEEKLNSEFNQLQAISRIKHIVPKSEIRDTILQITIKSLKKQIKQNETTKENITE